MKTNYNHILFCLISEYTMADAGKLLDDKMLQDLRMLPQGGKEVCEDPLHLLFLFNFIVKKNTKCISLVMIRIKLSKSLINN